MNELILIFVVVLILVCILMAFINFSIYKSYKNRKRDQISKWFDDNEDYFTSLHSEEVNEEETKRRLDELDKITKK